VTLGELQSWPLVAFGSATALRWIPAGLRPLVRLGVHGFATVLLLLSIVEVVFYAVMGSRVEWEVLVFALREARQVAPVFLSEVKPWHVGALVAALGAGLAPALGNTPNLDALAAEGWRVGTLTVLPPRYPPAGDGPSPSAPLDVRTERR
jgi:hypothetical protein